MTHHTSESLEVWLFKFKLRPYKMAGPVLIEESQSQAVVLGPRGERIPTFELMPQVPILKGMPLPRKGQGRPCVLDVHKPAAHVAGK
jgi:hypothetical protein